MMMMKDRGKTYTQTSARIVSCTIEALIEHYQQEVHSIDTIEISSQYYQIRKNVCSCDNVSDDSSKPLFSIHQQELLVVTSQIPKTNPNEEEQDENVVVLVVEEEQEGKEKEGIIDSTSATCWSLLPKFLRYQLEILMKLPNVPKVIIAISLIEAYTKSIRPLLFVDQLVTSGGYGVTTATASTSSSLSSSRRITLSSNGYSSVLMHYELLLICFIVHMKSSLSNSITDTNNNSKHQINNNHHHHYDLSSSSYMKLMENILYQTIETISLDLIMITTATTTTTTSQKNDPSHYIIILKPFVLSVLLHLLQDIIISMSNVMDMLQQQPPWEILPNGHIQRQLVCTLLSLSSSSGSSSTISSNSSSKWDSIIQIDQSMIHPLEMFPSLSNALCRISDHLVYPPPSSSSFIPHHQPFEYICQAMDWSYYEINCNQLCGLNDTVSNAAWSLWLHLAMKHNDPTISIADQDTFHHDNNHRIDTMRKVLVAQGWYPMSQLVRSYFFGRDNITIPSQQESSIQHRLHLGRTIVEPIPSPDDRKPYQKIPCRFHLLIRFVAMMDTIINSTILEELLPICYELLSATTDSDIGWGACILYHLLNISGPNALLSNTQFDNLYMLLDVVLKTCRHGPTLALIGLTQRMLLNQCNKHPQKRRIATQQWLILLDKCRYSTGDNVIWGILVTVTGLLYDHCQQENADALEMGRLGLTSLLPLMRCDPDNSEPYPYLEAASSTEVQELSLLALSNLIVAAHPIIPRHTNKILCELLACSAWFQKQQQLRSVTVKCDVILGLTQHVCHMVLIIGGEPAQTFLTHLEHDSTYEPLLRNAIATIACSPAKE